MADSELHHVSACADPRTERGDTFHQQLIDSIRECHGEHRQISIRGVGTPVDPEVNQPHLRQYIVTYVVDE
ncbi:hypothetical protein FZI85_06175 [Mycobacterium sp. CBMA293]|uniref:hypothetical protein n=1 Tax=unclassified Mycolicibacterium TaxID=2636767 RepID=UPI0012DC1FF0|nr:MULTISPECIES: hypothetical protein [unclassified Mycolicibacterium]MUL45158.1 hypothetical protein [Mycolicibacterium sp. CBMA 360]MUL56676.1 hypothetical protein [Mycolicibacterium sp. CBMA 335]MUL69715.1 hypothetical protein [Mycolicibacterium sp. CBMA 311]MUL91763.1 hypothetical protein [Mycolicibacterium sp. CBMA 230]MUM05502.1 hypothetical protein [Mycolicibacterium sp. CBMA 213]